MKKTSHSSIKRPSRSAKSPVRRRAATPLARVILAVRAGGLCQFCNRYLFEHHLTADAGNFGEIAHVVGFSKAGPRGRYSRPADIDELDNLMLLCPPCHKLIDDNPSKHLVDGLRERKRDHEARIRHVVSLTPDQRTSILQLKARIGGKPVAIPAGQIQAAVHPRYPEDLVGCVIDLTGIEDGSPAFLESAQTEIRRRLESFMAPRIKGDAPRNISVFALAPIPVLAYLGSQLSDKLEVNVFQFHKDTKDWVWKTEGEPVRYRTTQIQQGSDPTAVALVLSLSGTVPRDSLPDSIDDSFTIYEITLEDRVPDPTFLRMHEDLMAFRQEYQRFLAMLLKEHGIVDTFHLFPAVPAPVAILCGHEPLPKVHPSVLVFDYDKAKGGFTYQLRIN